MLRALSMTPGCSLRVSHNHSTAWLFGPDAPDFDLAFQFAPAGHCDMEQDDPIPRHLERKARLIAAGRDFRRFSEDGGHTGVRHVTFQRDVRSRDCFRYRIREPQGYDDRTNPRGLGRDLVLNRDRLRQVRWPGAAGRDRHGEGE